MRALNTPTSPDSEVQNNELINLLIPDESEVLSALPEKPESNDNAMVCVGKPPL